MSFLFPDDLNLFMRALLQYAFLLLRYAIFAGGVYFFFFVWKKRKWIAGKIQQKYPDRKQLLTEIKYSLLSFLIFCLISIAIRYLTQQGILEIKVYKDFSLHSVWYFIGTTIFLIFFHDTYFYWIHRLMHHPLLYERVHKVHHLSKDPTPFAAFAFHPLEAVLELGFVPIIVFTIPLHFSSVLILAMWQIVFNVMGHSGHEAFPHNTQKTIFRLVNTSTNHNMHHKYVRCNYGLYFNIWDRLMKTNHPKYEEIFEAVTARRDEAFRKEKEQDEPELTILTGAEQMV